MNEHLMRLKSFLENPFDWDDKGNLAEIVDLLEAARRDVRESLLRVCREDMNQHFDIRADDLNNACSVIVEALIADAKFRREAMEQAGREAEED